MKLFGNYEVNNNSLEISGIKVRDLAHNYGTPLYVMDEKLIRENCIKYKKYFLDNKVVYAGKAFSTLRMLNIINEEGLYLDVVSGGELFTAYKANFPMEKVLFHGNNKSIDEIQLGVNLGVGIFVVDNFYELEILESICKRNKIVQNIFLRIAPGIEAHTHSYIKTGGEDSKFGFPLRDNIYLEAVKKVIACENLNLKGLHCHIGSQIFKVHSYLDTIEVMVDIIKSIGDRLNYTIDELDIGGGMGVYYSKGDNPLDIKEFSFKVINKLKESCNNRKIKIPKLLIEPGRSIVANAGITVYKIGAIKDIPSVRKYISVDGGMTDNIRPALYNAIYECVLCDNIEDEERELVTISGKCCESADIIIDKVILPKCKSGDILAVLNTGAYCYSMSSNYNKLPKPAVIMVDNGRVNVVVNRETYMDVIKKERN